MKGSATDEDVNTSLVVLRLLVSAFDAGSLTQGYAGQSLAFIFDCES